ncbi:MAG: hypothetical protein LBQ12_08465 [Deltaproteobacteria bacterium]|jgi:hypothetical protein|nr:hypothetical protein [Deltaproteobacteria bacterium]
MEDELTELKAIDSILERESRRRAGPDYLGDGFYIAGLLEACERRYEWFIYNMPAKYVKEYNHEVLKHVRLAKTDLIRRLELVEIYLREARRRYTINDHLGNGLSNVDIVNACEHLLTELLDSPFWKDHHYEVLEHVQIAKKVLDRRKLTST